MRYSVQLVNPFFSHFVSRYLLRLVARDRTIADGSQLRKGNLASCLLA
jgi:hypothetical protein